jgi:site-specific DNA-methyltransferase (adenine-specific)
MKQVPKLEILPIDTLTPYANNARTHSDDQIKKIQASLREFGFVNPVLIDANRGVIAGHGRIEAAKREGMTEVPCVFVEHLTDAQKRAYILADNRLAELAGWDMDAVRIEMERLAEDGFGIEITGFEFDDIPMGKIAEDDFDADAAAEETIEPITEPGDKWQLGRHRLMCGDSTDRATVDRLMDGQKADMLLTDPPYNVDYGEKAEAINPYGYNFSPRHIENDKMSDSEFLAFLTKAFKNARNSIKPGGSFYIWHASVTLYEFETALKSAGMQTRQQLIWNKNSLVIGRQDYQWKHEPCLYGWIDGAAHYFVDDRKQTTVYEDAIPDFRKMKKDELIDLLSDIYSDKISATVINENRPSSSQEHPTMKPVKLIARLIKNSSRQEELVLDLFGGSGSTLIACEQLNRTCYMMELDPKYCDVIIKRWEALTGKKAERI